MNHSNRPTTDASEQILAKKLNFSDPDFFESLVRDHGGRMLSVARRYLHSEADAQDCVQDAFIQAYRNINKFEDRSAIQTWLHKIVVNTALMKIRATNRRPEELIDDRQELFDRNGSRVEMESEIYLSVEDTLIKEEAKRNIHNYINQLPQTPRSLLLLRDIEGYSTEETARLLNMTTSNVKTGLHRARKLLKKNLLNFSSTNMQAD